MPDYILIQLDFLDPNYVSYLGVDKIVVHVLQDNFFYVDEEIISKRKSRLLKKSRKRPNLFVPRKYFMVNTLPRQYENHEFGENVKESIYILENSVKASLAVTLLLNLLLAGSISLLWSFVNTL